MSEGAEYVLLVPRGLTPQALPLIQASGLPSEASVNELPIGSPPQGFVLGKAGEVVSLSVSVGGDAAPSTALPATVLGCEALMGAVAVMHSEVPTTGLESSGAILERSAARSRRSARRSLCCCGTGQTCNTAAAAAAAEQRKRPFDD